MRNDVSYEKKYRYLLYRIQQALLEMETEPKQYRCRRHLENGIYACEGFISAERINKISHEEMTSIKQELFADQFTDNSCL